MSRAKHAKRTADGGFTVVEVLIALGIAAIILALVLAVIPTLQRNSRNNARKQDVTGVLQAISQYELNNSATFPPGVGSLTLPKLYYYTPGSINLHAQTSSTALAHVGPVTSINIVRIYNYERCSSATAGTADSTGAGYGDVAALYAIETGGGTSGQCQQL